MSENLIDESEFIKPYNPWKRFGVFYLLAAVHIFIFYQLLSFTTIEEYINLYVIKCFAIVSVLCPLIIGLIMLLGYSKITTETFFTKIFAVFLLGLLYYFGLIVVTIFDSMKDNAIENPSAKVFAYLGLYCFVNLIITLAIALPVLRIRKKRLLSNM